MSQINPLSPTTTGELFSTGTSSVQLMFAQLQLQLSQANKNSAMEKMQTIQNNQALAKETAAMIAKARELQNDAANKDKGKGKTDVPPEMAAFFKDNGLSLESTGGSTQNTKDQWDYNIKSLTNFQEQIGSDTQQLMVFIQDYMGQYNAYLSGANSAIRESNQTLASLARNQ